MKNYLKLLSFLKNQRRLFAGAVAMMFVASLFEGFQLSLLVPLTDRVFSGNDIIVPNELPGFLKTLVAHINAMEPRRLLTLLLIAVLPMMMLRHGTAYAYQIMMNDVTQRVMREVRGRLYAKIQGLSLDYFSARRTGELISRITNDVAVIENAVSYGVTDLFRQTFLITIYVCIAFSIHWQAALIVFLVFPFVGWPISRIGKKLRKISGRMQERMADINSILLETISGIKVVKAFGTEQYEIERFGRQNHDFYKLRMKAVKRNQLISPITELFATICGMILIAWLGEQIFEKKLSFGVFVLFFGSVLSVISPVKKLGNVNAMTQQALAANERIYEVLDAEVTVKEPEPAVEFPVMARSIEFKDVGFRYEADGPMIFRHIDLQIKAGELVAVVGPTGTGKSTLVNLIPRFYDPVEGAVLMDGRNVKEASFYSLRHQIGIVSQETFLFNDTVGANIAYGTPGATQEDIETAATRAFAHGFVTAMPRGYETVIGDRGFRLSGGEKQRIAIARAILKNPPILILDEATSQLDSESEKFVQEALDDLMQGRTVIAIAHRLSTIKKADKILVLDKGQIVGLDRHERLLETCPLYRRLHDTQFKT